MTESRPGARPQIPGYVSAISGATAGSTAGIVVCPLDVVKTRLQVQGLQKTPGVGRLQGGVLATSKQICREEGMRGSYSGLGPLCVGYSPSWGIYFYVYKTVQKSFAPEHAHTTTSTHGEKHAHHNSHQWPPVHNWGPAIYSAVIAGACSTSATNPIWMIKTRLMAQSKTTSWQYTGMFDAARSIYVNEGWRAFYSGSGSASSGLPHVAIHFPSYERSKRAWAPHKEWYGISTASIASKIVASTITYPHEVVRSRNQIRSQGNKYCGISRTVRTSLVEEGWRAFYAGSTANVCRAIPSSAVTSSTFELVSASLSKHFYEHIENSPVLSGDTEDMPTLSQSSEVTSDSGNQIASPSDPLSSMDIDDQ